MITGYLDKLVDAVFPKSIYCICCGNIIDSSRSYCLCDHCMDHIHWNLEMPKKIDDVLFVKCMEYGIYERSIIFSMKYGGHKYIARPGAEIMYDKLVQIGQISDVDFEDDAPDQGANKGSSLSLTSTIVVPVPMYLKKERQRGFNQASLLGEFLARKMKVDFCGDLLVRTRETKAMRSLSPTERMENIKNSIDLNEKYGKIARYKKIILIDDFYTTGSTALECVKSLRRLEPVEILFLAFAAR